MDTSTATFFTDTGFNGTAQTYRAGETVDLQGGEFDGKFRSLRMSDNVAVTMWKDGVDSGGEGGETTFSLDTPNLAEGFRALRVVECGGVPLLIRFRAPQRDDGATPAVSFSSHLGTVHVPADGEYHRIDTVKAAGVSVKRRFHVRPTTIPMGATEPAARGGSAREGSIRRASHNSKKETHDAVFVWDKGQKTAAVSHWDPIDRTGRMLRAGERPRKTLDITSDGAGRFTVTPAT
ncbi:beta/gamma crystallin domain-containing protein [Streptomyces sp. NPDC015131]|uniref:beta/gamma crystallin domain-containing protein n=1 Tax=Streptomyces sp. NPDC015131 TaxID=3364941 RepID=UPI003701B2B8